MREVTGLLGMPGSGKSTIGKKVAETMDAVCMDNDIHGYPPSLRAYDAKRLGLESIDTPSSEMNELAKMHAIALEARVRAIAAQGFDVVMQAPGEGFGNRGDDGKSKALIEGMQDRFAAEGCSLFASYLVPLPEGVRKNVQQLTITPDELEEILRNETAFAELCNGLDRRFIERGLTEEQRTLDAPKIGNPEFVQSRLTRIVKSMRDSDMPAIPVFLGEDVDCSAERVLEVHRLLRETK